MRNEPSARTGTRHCGLADAGLCDWSATRQTPVVRAAAEVDGNAALHAIWAVCRGGAGIGAAICATYLDANCGGTIALAGAGVSDGALATQSGDAAGHGRQLGAEILASLVTGTLEVRETFLRTQLRAVRDGRCIRACVRAAKARSATASGAAATCAPAAGRCCGASASSAGHSAARVPPARESAARPSSAGLRVIGTAR